MTSADTLLPFADGSDSGKTACPRAAKSAVGVQAESQAAPSGPGRRGPLRPEVWLNTRQRASARQRVYYFRGLDITAVSLITLIVIHQAATGGLAQARLVDAAPFILAGLIALGLMRSLGLYKFDSARDPVRHLASIAAVVVIAGAVGAVVDLALAGAAPSAAYGRWTLATLGLLAALHCVWRLLVAQWRRRGDLTPNIAVVGATRHAERLIQDALDRRDLNVLGVFDDRLARTPQSLVGVPVLGDSAALLNHRLTPYIDRIVLAIDPRAEARVRDLTAQLGALPIPLTLLVDPKGADQRNAALEKLARPPMPLLGGVIDPERRAFNKRLQDLALSSVALILLAPALATIALMVRLDSPGPAFFRQRRHGFNQEEIVVWKFRTMRHEAADASASRQVTADDDRVTRIGRLLRASSLDELPQLVNVLRGEMSLVGPRPHAIGMKTGSTESARLVADYAHRHRIKPGMTGWAAIKGSRGPLHTAADVRRRVQLDIDYIERQSFWLDLWIIVATIPVLLGDRMAIR